jgi:hypothetical protein
MISVEDIQEAIRQLPASELARFRAWFEAFDADRFDAAIDRDAQSGQLDAVAEEATAACHARKIPRAGST